MLKAIRSWFVRPTQIVDTRYLRGRIYRLISKQQEDALNFGRGFSAKRTVYRWESLDAAIVSPWYDTVVLADINFGEFGGL